MTDEIIFYTNPASRGRIIRWMLEEVGKPYRTEIIEYGPAMKGPAYRAINPMGKVPALRHGETVITVSGALPPLPYRPLGGTLNASEPVASTRA